MVTSLRVNTVPTARFGEAWLGHPLSAPLAALFGCAVWLRRLAYDRKLLHVTQPGCFTVSVGGLEVGGSGKTPVAGLLLRALVAAGRKPGLLSRGYGRATRTLRVRLPGAPASAADIGDEPAMLVASGIDVPVAACPRRAQGAAALTAQGCETLLLDDGFSHRALARHLDIVVLRGDAPFANGHLLPWGRLREPASSLRRASVVWLHFRDVPDLQTPAWFARWCPQATLVISRAAPTAALDREQRPVPLAGRRIIAAAGIARPDDLRQTLTRLGADVLELVPFADHHRYTADDVSRLQERRAAHQADAVVVTSKDAIKLTARWPDDALWHIDTRVSICHGAAALAAHLGIAVETLLA